MRTLWVGTMFYYSALYLKKLTFYLFIEGSNMFLGEPEVKSTYYKSATKFEKIAHSDLTFTKKTSNPMWVIFSNYMALSENIDFN